MSDPDDTTTLLLECTRADLDALERVAEEMRRTLSATFPSIDSGLTREVAALILIRFGMRARERGRSADGDSTRVL